MAVIQPNYVIILQSLGGSCILSSSPPKKPLVYSGHDPGRGPIGVAHFSWQKFCQSFYAKRSSLSPAGRGPKWLSYAGCFGYSQLLKTEPWQPNRAKWPTNPAARSLPSQCSFSMGDEPPHGMQRVADRQLRGKGGKTSNLIPGLVRELILNTRLALEPMNDSIE